MADDAIPHTHGKGGIGRRSAPYGKTLEFYRAVVADKGEAFARSWLNDQNCDFTDDTVFTTSIGAERLGINCHNIAKSKGVFILECADVRYRFTGVMPQRHAELGRCSDIQRQYFVHAKIRLGLKEEAQFVRSVLPSKTDPRHLHTTPEYAERLTTEPRLKELLELYGASVSGDIADVY